MIYIFGDLHLSAINPWNYDVGENFIKWFSNFTSSLKDDDPHIIWLGDITEKDVNPGDVIDQEYRVFDICSKVFKSTTVIMGNHDIKLYRQKAQHSLKFLRNFNNVDVVDSPKTVNICNTKIRILPHIRVQGQSLSDYYSNMKFDDEVDLTVGHWNIYDPNNSLLGGVKIDNMKSKNFCLGHIHTRISEEYTGSIFPNKVSEEGERVYKVFNNGKLIKEEKLPTFLKYEVIKYPDNVPQYNDTIVRVYTVLGLTNLTAAKSYYKNLYIRGVEPKKYDNKTLISDEIFLYKDNLQAYNDWLRETKYPISRKAAVIISNMLRKNTSI